jgi:hypothetical protein
MAFGIHLLAEVLEKLLGVKALGLGADSKLLGRPDLLFGFTQSRLV